MAESYFRYWGKANPRERGGWHLLPFHALDVAAVGRAYLLGHRRLRRYFAAALQVTEDQGLEWFSFWLALHDLGKFTSAFQSQRNDVVTQLRGEPVRGIGSYPINGLAHDSLGELIWRAALLEKHDALGLGAKARHMGDRFAPWIAAVTGHHGEPPVVAAGNSLSTHSLSADEAAAAEFVREVLALLGRESVLAVIAQADSRLASSGKRLSWWLAGLTVLSDWLGSNTEYFKYHPDEQPLETYWQHAQRQATRALAETGVLPQSVAASVSVQGLFGADRIPALTPLQQWAEDVEMAKGPQLFLLEDVTGAGKTEAALTLAGRLMAKGEADGLYVALPTMATANAMFNRVETMAPRLFGPEAHPNLILAHGQRHLVPGFARLRERGEADSAQRDETASTRCAAWLADHGKKALLAQVGVGTLDQAVLGVLHARHQSLRLLGLFGKVLLVDEVHACDEYQRRLLEALLRFHAEAGGSAILLSATLPLAHRQVLSAAYARGAAIATPELNERQGYPLATRLHVNAPPQEEVLATRTSVRRCVDVGALHTEDAVCAAIAEALARGQCVAWVRNTVADAVAACERLAAHCPTLFHARFAMGDRLRIERAIQCRFGNKSRPQRRRGQLVIASQVLEMSLDCDFDLLISDLAPIDRLIQRAGRLQRHRRNAQGQRIGDDAPDGRAPARLLVHQPPFVAAPKADWFSHFLPRAAKVYPHHGQLWLTAECLQGGGLAMPEDARRFIEAVYGEDAQTRIPSLLAANAHKVEGENLAARNAAQVRTLKFEPGYTRIGSTDGWLRDDAEPGSGLLDEWEAITSTRLGEPSVVVRLAAWRDGRWQPWCRAEENAWDLSALRLPARLIAVPEIVDGEPKAPVGMTAVEWAALRTELPDEGRWSPVLAMKMTNDNEWRAQARHRDGIVIWGYQKRTGLKKI